MTSQKWEVRAVTDCRTPKTSLMLNLKPHSLREEVRPIKSEIAIYNLLKLDFEKYINSQYKNVLKSIYLIKSHYIIYIKNRYIVTGLSLKPRITLYYARHKKRIDQVTLYNSLTDYYKLSVKGNSLKPDLYQVYKLNLLF